MSWRRYLQHERAHYAISEASASRREMMLIVLMKRIDSRSPSEAESRDTSLGGIMVSAFHARQITRGLINISSIYIAYCF